MLVYYAPIEVLEYFVLSYVKENSLGTAGYENHCLIIIWLLTSQKCTEFYFIFQKNNIKHFVKWAIIYSQNLIKTSTSIKYLDTFILLKRKEKDKD